MMKLDDLFTIQNTRLFDMLFRHQIYLEGWKTSFSRGYEPYLIKLYGEFGRFVKQTRYQQVDQFTKIQLMEFVRKLTLAQGKFYSTYTDELIDILKQFMVIDGGIHRDIMRSVTQKDVTEANIALKVQISSAEYSALSPGLQGDYFAVDDHYELADHYAPNAQASGIYGLAATKGDDRANTQLWANITNAPIPANGLLLLNMLNTFGKNVSVKISQLVNKGYAQSWTMDKLDDEFLRLMAIVAHQHNGIVLTAIQHVSAETQAAISSLYFERYQWVSILDSKTSQICIDLDGNIYIYGEGPLAPIHYRCRSKNVPISSDKHAHDPEITYADWIKAQPEWFLVDAFTDHSASTAVSSTKPLTLSEFQGKVKYILGEV